MNSWNGIGNPKVFLEFFGDFRDACLKEARYVSGAYVDTELAMYPYNDKRSLHLVFQRQCEGPAVLELAFDGVRTFHLEPSDAEYDCSIISASLQTGEDGLLWWSDWLDFDPKNPPYGQQCTWVCAESARWKIRDSWLGDGLVYDPDR